MMNKTIKFVSLLLVFFPLISHAQYIGHFTQKDRIKKDTLTDTVIGIRYIIDKDRIFVKAIDKAGKLLWKTDPYTDNKIEEYRVKRPTIVYFAFSVNRQKNQVIVISYNNSQFGDLDKKTGSFLYRGQD